MQNPEFRNAGKTNRSKLWIYIENFVLAKVWTSCSNVVDAECEICFNAAIKFVNCQTKKKLALVAQGFQYGIYLWIIAAVEHLLCHKSSTINNFNLLR